MRYDAEHKQRTRELLLRQAASEIRQHGPDKVGVAALMAKAGLTHGGFYAHFASKDALLAQAISTMFSSPEQRLTAATQGVPAAEGLRNFIDGYLSMTHRARRDVGCPLAALSSDIVRMDGAARANFHAGLAAMLDRLTGLIGALAREDANSLANSVMAEMVGALALARALEDSNAALQMLDAAKASILGRLGLAGS